MLLPLSGKLYVFDRATGKATRAEDPAGTILDPKWSPDGKKVAYVRDHDVYVYDLATDKETPVTKGGTAEKTHGLAEFVAQEEMGRFTGYWWSPDGEAHRLRGGRPRRRRDVVRRRPDRSRIRSRCTQFYPRPGKKNVSVRLGIVPVDRRRHGLGRVGPRRSTSTWRPVRWDKHGPLTIQVQDRKQQETAAAAGRSGDGQDDEAARRSRTRRWSNLRAGHAALAAGRAEQVRLGRRTRRGAGIRTARRTARVQATCSVPSRRGATVGGRRRCGDAAGSRVRRRRRTRREAHLCVRPMTTRGEPRSP